MSSTSVTVHTGGVSSAIYLDPQKFTSGVGLVCVANTITGTYTVQVSGDAPPGPPTNWMDHQSLNSQTGSAGGNLQYPVTAVRLNGTSLTSGSVVLSVVQAERPLVF